MSTQTLTPPLVVPPPPGGLGSSNNYILSDQSNNTCNNITGLVVTIDVTQDIVLKSSENSKDQNGFGFQLNCYSPPGFEAAWQQYIFYVLKNIFPRPGEGDTALEATINNWPANASGDNYFINEFDGLMGMSNTTIPAGYQLQIRLINDNQNNIVGAHWIVNYIGVLPTPSTPLTGYVTLTNAGNTELHLNYIGIDGHIHERPGTPTKPDNDLSVLAGSSTFPATDSALDAYADLDGGQHVNFIGTDGHVHELYLASGGHWIDNDLIVKSGNGITPRANSPLDGYVDNDNGQHVNFIGIDGHVHELYIKPKGQWVNNDLIMLSGNGMTPSRTSPLYGYMAQDNGQHVNFIDPDGHVRELYNLHSAQWLNNDLTQLAAQHAGTSVPPASNSSALCGYYADYLDGGTQHVNFTGTDGHVHDLSIAPNGQWAHSDFTQLSGSGATAAPNSALSSYGTTHNEFFVNFIDVNDGHLHQFALVAPAQCIDGDLNNIPLVNFLKSPLGSPGNPPVAPINAFELVLIGPPGGDNAVFSSGAGTFSYVAGGAPLTVQNSFPPCTEVKFGTAETSNSVYGSLDAGPSIVTTQTFSIDPTESIIRFQGPVVKSPKIPRKSRETLKPIPVSHEA
jgi:hypothetical protein